MDRPQIPSEIAQALWSFVATWALAFLGRLGWHVQEVTAQRRRFWSWQLLWEVLTALSMGYVAEGVADYLGLSGKQAIAVVIIVAYLGPRGLEELIRRFLKRDGAPPSGK